MIDENQDWEKLFKSLNGRTGERVPKGMIRGLR